MELNYIIRDTFDLINSDVEEEEQLRTFKKYKIYFTVIEIVSFILFLVFGVITLLDYIFYPSYEIFQFFQTPQFIITVITGIIFLITPTFIKFIAVKGQEIVNQIRINAFKSDFTKNFSGYTKFDFDIISNQFKIPIEDLKHIFEKLLSDGLIKGELIGKKFIIAPGFQIQSLETMNFNNFRKNIVDYVKPYRWLNIPKTAKYFHVPTEIALKEIHELIDQKKVIGFLDGENLVRDMSVIYVDMSDLPECPYCQNRVLPHSKYCSICGEEINLDKDLFNDEKDEFASDF